MQRRLGQRLIGHAQGVALAALVMSTAQANPDPSRAAIAHGHAAFATPAAGVLEIRNAPNTIINWQQFSIQQGEVTNFIQDSPASAILNRVTGPMRSDILGTLSVSVDDRFFENKTTFVNEPIGVDVRSRPLSIGYSGRYESGFVRRSFYVLYASNLGSGGDNNDRTYAFNRAGAEEDWFTLRFGVDLEQPLPREFALKARLSGQYSSDLLIPGEQFGLGGANSVRGFEERELAGDEGLQTTVEVWTPELKANVRLLAFIDAGFSNVGNRDRTGTNSEMLASLGLGMRWFWRGNVGLSFDAAYVFEGNDLLFSSDRTRSDTVDFHGSLFVRF